MGYGLPKSVEINGEEYEIRYDFRVILDIFEALNDIDLNDQERALAVLQMFYVDFDGLEDYDAALKACFQFLNGGKENQNTKKEPQLVNWESDFSLVAAPVNRGLGYEIRAVEYDVENNSGGVHWYTFLSAYMEIGDCLFAQVINIREKKAKGKSLNKTDKEFYRKNRDMVDIKIHYTETEKDVLKQWTGESQS